MAPTRQSKPPKDSLATDPLAFGAVALAFALIFGSWPVRLLVIGAAVVVLAVYTWIYLRRQERWRQLGLDEIDRMSGEEFEQRLWRLFADLGYGVERTPVRGDWGADLVLRKAGTCTVVQAKRYGRPVGVGAVQEVVAAKAQYGCSGAIVVTNAAFTPAARQLAQANGVELWDRERLANKLWRSRRPDGRPS